MSLTVAALIIGWLACGIVGAGYCFAYLQDKYPSIAEHGYYADLTFAWLLALGGPAHLIVALTRISPPRRWRLW